MSFMDDPQVACHQHHAGEGEPGRRRVRAAARGAGDRGGRD